MAYSLEQKISKDVLAGFCRRNHISILVEFEQDLTPGLFSIVRMEMELAEMLGRKVDLRTPEDLSQYFRDEVVRNAELQYQA